MDLIQGPDNNNIFPMLFIIEQYEEIEGKGNLSYLISSVEMRHYSGIASEQEVLFLPLSSFKVTHLDESTFQKKKRRP